MTYKRLILSTILAFLISSIAVAQDTVDAIRYSINLDLGHRTADAFSGYTDIHLRTTKSEMSSFELDLQVASVDSLFINNNKVDDYIYNRRYLLINVPTEISVRDTFCVRVY